LAKCFLGNEWFCFWAKFLILEKKTENKEKKRKIPIGTTIGMLINF